MLDGQLWQCTNISLKLRMNLLHVIGVCMQVAEAYHNLMRHQVALLRLSFFSEAASRCLESSTGRPSGMSFPGCQSGDVLVKLCRHP